MHDARVWKGFRDKPNVNKIVGQFIDEVTLVARQVVDSRKIFFGDRCNIFVFIRRNHF